MKKKKKDKRRNIRNNGEEKRIDPKMKFVNRPHGNYSEVHLYPERG